MIKLKAFIYRFSNIFGLSIYLADKEEQAYIDSQQFSSKMAEDCSRGLWQANHGFTTVWTWGQPWYVAVKTKIKHAFDFRR